MLMSMIDTTDTERKIAERIDTASAGALELSQQAGGLGFSNMAEAMQFAKIMAISGFAVPKHLRGNVGGCMAITIQAVEWKMSPFAVANKSYLVNDRLAYESQLIQAVVLQRAPIKGRFKVEFSGEGDRRRCTVTATLKEGGEKDYTSPEIGKIPIKNSPLWKNDPDQQLVYYAGRALCRRHFPDVLLGIYSPDELYEETRRGPEHARDVTPKAPIAAGGNGGPTTGTTGTWTPAHRDPPYDPETGEITDEVAREAQEAERRHQEALADQTGEEAARQLAAKLDERVAQQYENGQESIGGPRPPDDPKLAPLLDKARAAATNGLAKFNRWEGGLNGPDSVRIGPHLKALREAAAAADAEGA
jgi:hypothetical protein